MEAVRARRAEQAAEAARASEALLRQRLEYRLQINEAGGLYDSGKPAEAERALNAIQPRFVESGDAQVEMRRDLAWEYCREGLWTNALSNFAALVQDDSPKWTRDIALDHYYYTICLVTVNDLTAYDSYRRALAADTSRTNDPEGCEFLCRLTLLMPADQDFMRSLTTFAEIATKLCSDDASHDRSSKAWDRFTLALIAYRNGDNSNTLRWTADSLSQKGSDLPLGPSIHAIRAMALYRLGQVQEADVELALARRIVDPIFRAGMAKGKQGDLWFRWHEARIYLNEAEKMMDKSASESAR